MFIGLPKEIKNEEHRVALTPNHVKQLVKAGHVVAVECGAGWNAGFTDQDYEDAGGYVSESRTVWNHDLIVKVKEPLPEENIRGSQIIFSYLHLAANRDLTERLVKSNATAIAFETILDEDGCTPVLDPMSVIAGELAAYKAAEFLLHHNGGKGILMADARITVLGYGTAGEAAARVAAGMGAAINIVELESKLPHVNQEMSWLPKPAKEFHKSFPSTPEEIKHSINESDVVIGCVHVPGAPTARLVTEEMVKEMKPKTVLIDVAIDQGGCFETSSPTSHTNPTFVKHDVIHYCVPNMPGVVPITASREIADHIWPYLLEIIEDPLSVPSGVNVHGGKVVHPAVAKAHDL